MYICIYSGCRLHVMFVLHVVLVGQWNYFRTSSLTLFESMHTLTSFVFAFSQMQAAPVPPLSLPARPSPASPWRRACPSPTWPSRPVLGRASSLPTRSPTITSRDGPCVPPEPSGMPPSSTGIPSNPTKVPNTTKPSSSPQKTLPPPSPGVPRRRMPCP